MNIIGIAFLIVAIGVVYFLITHKSGGRSGASEHGGYEGHTHGGGNMADATDPVCGMKVEATNSTLQSDYKGNTVYFCSAHCKEKFDRDPAAFEDVLFKGHEAHAGCCG